MTDIPWLEFSADLLFEDEADWPVPGPAPVDLPGDGVLPVVDVVTRISVWTP